MSCGSCGVSGMVVTIIGGAEGAEDTIQGVTVKVKPGERKEVCCMCGSDLGKKGTAKVQNRK